MSAASTAQGAPRQSGGARRRSIARLGAVQALYQLELNPGLGTEAAIREFVRDRLGQALLDLNTSGLVHEGGNVERLDRRIEKLSGPDETVAATRE